MSVRAFALLVPRFPTFVFIFRFMRTGMLALTVSINGVSVPLRYDDGITVASLICSAACALPLFSLFIFKFHIFIFHLCYLQLCCLGCGSLAIRSSARGGDSFSQVSSLDWACRPCIMLVCALCLLCVYVCVPLCNFVCVFLSQECLPCASPVWSSGTLASWR